jgi:hypothetical protein
MSGVLVIGALEGDAGRFAVAFDFFFGGFFIESLRRDYLRFADFQRFSAAWRAISVRRFWLKASALAFPPRRPSDTAAGSFLIRAT